MRTLGKILFPIGFTWSVSIYAVLGGVVGFLLAGEVLTGADIVTGVLIGIFVGTIGGAIFKEVIEHPPHQKYKHD